MASGTTSGSLIGSSGCLAARADLEVFLGVGATSGITSGSLTSGSGAAFADLEALLGEGAGSASFSASSTSFAVLDALLGVGAAGVFSAFAFREALLGV